MADTGSETHSGELPVLQPLPPTHFVNEKTCSSQKQQEQPDLQVCLNNSFQLFADTLMSKFENLTNKIVEQSPSRAKTKGKRLRKGRQSDDGNTSFEPSSDSEGELEEQIRQRKKKQKVKIDSSRARADERKECHKGSGDDESEHEYDDRVRLHADDDSELAGNLNNILGTTKESEDEESDSDLKGLIQELDKDEEIGEKTNKDLPDIANKVWQNHNAFEKFKTKMKTYKKPQNRSDLLVKKCNKEIWQERMNAQDRNKDLKVQKVQGTVLKGAFAICEVTNALINLKNNKDHSGKELRLQLSNVIKICTESLTFLGMANLEGDNIRRQYLSKILPPKLSPLTKDVPTPSEFLLGNNLNDRIGIIQTSQKMLQTYSNCPYYKNSKNLPRFPKNPGNQNKGYSSQTRGYNNHQKQRQGYQRSQYHKRN